MKGEKTNIYLDFPVIRNLSNHTFVEDWMKRDLQFLVLYRFCLTNLDDGINVKQKLSRFGEIDRVDAILNSIWFASTELLEEIQSHKKTIREDRFNFSDYLLDISFSVNGLRKLITYITVSLANVQDLLKGEIIPHEKLRFESLKEKLDLFRKVFKFACNHCSSDYEITYLHSKIPSIRAWAWNAACLCLLIWALDEKDGNMTLGMNLILSKLQWNFDRFLPDVTKTCLLYLMAAKPSADVRLKAGELVSRFVKFLLGNLKGYLAKDSFGLLLNGMILLITFHMDHPPPDANQRQLIKDAADAVNMAASLIISIGSGKNEAEVRKIKATNLFHYFEKMFYAIKAEVRKIYHQLFLDSSSFNCPRINILKFFDPMIENFKGISLHFPNHPILTIYQELLLLRNVLKSSNLKELLNEHREQKNPWTQISNVAHQVDRTIKSFRYLKGFLWVDMLCLLDLKEEIKRIRTVVEGIQGQHMHDIDACRIKMNPSPIVPSQIMDEVVVGLEDKAKDIRDRLTSGPDKLKIISIIGMPGLGKTTLAKKVYDDPSIKCDFTKRAWCTVSQSYDSKKLLLDILNTVTGMNDNFFDMEEEELADRLRKCLKGQKYLIVMDDIWEDGAWNALKLSFPDEGEYGRILFTSRIHDVALKAKSDSFLYHLSPLSKEERWELLEKRLYHDKDIWQRDFVKVGEQIAKDCKGLPLAIVLVAGLLKKKLEDLDWWKQIREHIGSRISEQDCAHILDLSYKHLPEPLKACFLYFGLFPEDKVIRVQKLAKLWVSEGFIPKQGTENVEVVANEYVIDLVGRSLLIVTNRSSSGGIKACRIHDLLREFCLAKSEEENFFKLLRGNDVSHFSKDSISKHCRVCIQAQQCSSFLVRNTSPLHSLLVSPPTCTPEPFGIDCSSFCDARFLQVLDLEDAKFHGEFPEEVTALVLLKYLAIWCSTKLIPPTIVRLENLETLRVRTENTCVFPSRILEMENLKHVDIGKIFTYGLFRNAPPMKNIQSLSFPFLPYGKETEIFLRKIPTIRKLRCQFDSPPSDGQIEKLDFPNHLESLNATQEGLSRLCSFGFSLPSALKKLTLSNFRLPWTELSTIAKLQNLEVLKLLAHAFTGKQWNAEKDEFLKLKFLKLQNLDIGEWSASDENFPSLEHIVVEQCHRLEEIPTTFGELLDLRMIQVRRCHSSVVDSARDVEEQQLDLGNNDFQLLTMQILKQKCFG